MSGLMTLDILRSHKEYPTDSLCFHAQQYAEKMIKAKLVSTGVRPPKVHDPMVLLEAFPDSPEIHRAVDIAGMLESYAVDVMYPEMGMQDIRGGCRYCL